MTWEFVQSLITRQLSRSKDQTQTSGKKEKVKTPQRKLSSAYPSSTCQIRRFEVSYKVSFRMTRISAFDSMGSPSLGLPNFTTPAGHIYQWVKAPFDYPLSARFWQYLLNNHFRECAGFACFYLTTFVICATGQGDARDKIKQLYEVAQKHGLRLSIPSVSSWADDCEGLGLDKIYNGVRPAGFE